MATTDWKFSAKHLVYCSCDFGCPCDANAPPTYTSCEGVVGYEITTGHYGDTPLDGLRFAVAFHFPKAIHHGNGTLHPIIDERADEDQRNALLTIMSGEDQPPNTMFAIFAAITETVVSPEFLPIEFEFDLEGRTGRMAAPGLIECENGPIRNPVTGDPHRMRVVMPEGFEYAEAEMAAGRAKGSGPVAFDFTDRHCSLSEVTYDNNGLVA
jgi:hypothetical protein